MLIKLPELTQEEITGFTSNIDIFNRKPLGEALSNLLESTEENLIIGIDGQWGEGKSFFAKMLSAHLKSERETPTIYFDAFENDYQKDPFLAIAAEIQELIEAQPKAVKTEFRNKILNASKAITRGAIRVGLKTLTAGLLDETILDELDTSDDLSEEISGGIDKVLSNKLDETKNDKNSLSSFKKALEALTLSIGNGKPVIFIIDELDRCRPDFSLELIEQIKHLFTVRNLKFLLITNKSQLHASIHKRYGQNINSHIYLQKFIDLWIELPRVEEQHSSHTEKYFNHIIEKMAGSEEKPKNKLTLMTLKDIFISNKTSYRGIQKTLTYFSIFHNASNNTEYYDYYQSAAALVCFSKAEQPQLLKRIRNKENHKAICADIYPEHNEHRNDFSFNMLSLLIEYLTTSEERRREIMVNREIRSDLGRGIQLNILETISNTINLFSK